MQPGLDDANAERVDRFEGRARRQAVRIIRKIVSIALFLAVCMWFVIGWSLWTEFSSARAIGSTEGYNLSAAFAENLTNTLDTANAALASIDRIVRSAPPDRVKLELQQVVASITVRDIAVRITGPDGRQILFQRGPDPSATNAGDPPEFVAGRQTLPAVMTIGPDIVAPAGVFVPLRRQLTAATGGFGGEAVLLIKPADLLPLVRQTDLGNRGSVALASADGVVLAGFTSSDKDGNFGVGTFLGGDVYPASIAPGQTIPFTRRGRLLNIKRLITMRRLSRYDLRVLVALDLDDVLGPARLHIWLISLVGVAATGLMAALSFLLSREVWRRTRNEIDLAYDRDRLRSARSRIETDRARLADTNRELLITKEIAEAANRARTQFLAHMSHELRTPLHAIIGFSELIQEQAPTKPGSPPIAGYAADIWSSGRHLLELINAILDISKVESGTAKLTETVFPVADLARASLVSVRAQAEARNIQVDLSLPDAVLRLRADRTRLLQVLINLLSNAVKFTRNDGHVSLSVSVLASGELIFSVSDNGIGMTEAEIEIAMEPFGQVENTLSRSFEGTGLGLPLARKLTELHGGRLELTSKRGQGTTAIVVMPAERLIQRDSVRTGVP